MAAAVTTHLDEANPFVRRKTGGLQHDRGDVIGIDTERVVGRPRVVGPVRLVFFAVKVDLWMGLDTIERSST